MTVAYLNDTLVGDAAAVIIIPAVADGTDQSAIINQTLASASPGNVVMLPAGEFWIGSNIEVPDGVTLIGAGQNATTISVLTGFQFTTGNHAILLMDGSGLADLTLDVQKTNHGLGSDLRIHGVVGHGTGFHVENVTSKNVTGYAFWGNGVVPETLASGTFTNCYAENANILFETSWADGVVFTNCVGTDGDDDIWLEAAFHPVTGSKNVTFRDCYYYGDSQIVSVVANTGDQTGILFENVRGHSTDTFGVYIEGPGHNEVTFRDCVFTAEAVNAGQFNFATVTLENTHFASQRIAVAVLKGTTVTATDSTAIALHDPSFNGAVYGVYASGAVTWTGGTVAASGAAGSQPLTGNYTLSPTTSQIAGEVLHLSETATATINSRINDLAVGDMQEIVKIAGIPVVAGQSVTLASGARVTLQADGTLSYQTNGAFDRLPAGSSFVEDVSYTLANGIVASARMTVNGVASAGDWLAGDADSNPINGTAGADLFVLSQGGNDTASGLAGDDIFYFGNALSAGDRLYGGPGFDTIVLKGNYAAGINLTGAMTHGIEALALATGKDRSHFQPITARSDFRIIAADTAVAAGATLIVDSTGLVAEDRLIYDGSAERDGRYEFRAGAGVDQLRGGAGADTFIYNSARDFLGDPLNGGGGEDRLMLNGQFRNVRLTASSLQNVEAIALGSAATGYAYYNLTLDDGNVAAGGTLVVDGARLRYGETLCFYGYQEFDGQLDLTGGASNDVLFGGQQADTLRGGLGSDYLHGGAGDDLFSYGSIAELTGDRIFGGVGYDTVLLHGLPSGGFAMPADLFSSIERLLLQPGTSAARSFNLTLNDGNVAAGAMLTVDMSNFAVNQTVMIYGQHETNGRLDLIGGTHHDYLIGGAGDDILTGGLGRDYMQGRAGNDVFAYSAAAESTGLDFDQIIGFEFGADKIDLPGEVTGLEILDTAPQLRTSSFDADLAAAVDDVLDPSEGVLFTAGAGNFAGRTFLVVDANGDGAYRAGNDFLIELSSVGGTPPLVMSELFI